MQGLGMKEMHTRKRFAAARAPAAMHAAQQISYYARKDSLPGT